jgi:hypothetical protein
MSFDNPWQWSETAASNTAIASIDITGTTGKVKDGDNAIRAAMAQIITMEGKGTAVASAATLTLTGPERYFHITGSTGPITDIDFTDAVDGRWAWLIFDSTPTLTHNATTLVLPGAANIVAAAGDSALFVQDSSDNIICLAYIRAAQAPYTTGTFTPNMSFGGSSTGVTGTFSGVYTKIGNAVKFKIAIVLTSNGTGTGSALVTGLPFTSANDGIGTAVSVVAISNFSGLTAGVSAQVSANTTSIALFGPGTAGDTALTDTNVTNTATFTVSGTYFV